jgi:hypothetical protein
MDVLRVSAADGHPNAAQQAGPPLVGCLPRLLRQQQREFTCVLGFAAKPGRFRLTRQDGLGVHSLHIIECPD